MENIIDKTIGIFSPEAQAKRLRARMLINSLRVIDSKLSKRGYDSASKKPRLQSWDVTSGSVNSENGPALHILRDRSRDLTRNNGLAKRAKEVITTNTVGLGIYLQFKNTNDSKKSIRNKTILENLWNEWANSTRCDADGVTNFYGLQALAMDTMVESGESLARKRVRRLSDGLKVPLKIQILEPDFIDTNKTELLSNGGIIIQGKEYNRIGELKAFHIFENHPGDIGLAGNYLQKTKRITADNLKAQYRVERPGQVRGIPWGSSILVKLNDLGEYEDAALVQQKVAACFSAFLRKPNDPDADDEYAKEDDKDVATRKLNPGIVQPLPPGWDITFSQPPIPNAQGEYTREQKMNVSIGYGITYESISGDYSKVNFSSARMGRIDFLPNAKRWQSHLLIPQFCQPCLEWFLEACEIAGYDISEVSTKWITPKVEPIDPVKESNARQKNVRNGFVTLSEVIRSDGRDPVDVFDEREKELKMMDEKGILTDTDTRNTNFQGGIQGKEDAEES